MSRSKKLKHFNSIIKDKAQIIKDKAQIIKAKFSITNHTTSSIQLAVLRATTRSTRSPPREHIISALVSFGHTTTYSASACISTIINRLHHHHEPNAYVTLKSLITLHNMISSGTFVYPVSNTSLSFLNLSRFMDSTNAQSREFSFWAQWYARYLENNLCTSSTLGCEIFLSKREVEKKKEKIKFSMYMDLFKEIKSLVSMIEVICTAPKSLHCQTNDIIYEVMRLVGDDYRMIQHHTLIRLTELNERVEKLNSTELNELTQCLTRLESCKGRLTELFVNRGRNVSFWDFESELMEKVVRLREMKSVSLKMIEYNVTESTQLNKEISRPLRILPLGLLPFGKSNNNWSNFEKVNQNMCIAAS